MHSYIENNEFYRLFSSFDREWARLSERLMNWEAFMFDVDAFLEYNILESISWMFFVWTSLIRSSFDRFWRSRSDSVDFSFCFKVTFSSYKSFKSWFLTL